MTTYRLTDGRTKWFIESATLLIKNKLLFFCRAYIKKARMWDVFLALVTILLQGLICILYFLFMSIFLCLSWFSLSLSFLTCFVCFLSWFFSYLLFTILPSISVTIWSFFLTIFFVYFFSTDRYSLTMSICYQRIIYFLK